MYQSLTNEPIQSIRTIQDDEQAMAIFGPQNDHLASFENELDVLKKTNKKK